MSADAVSRRWEVLACVSCCRTATEEEMPAEAWPRLIALHADHDEGEQ